MYEMEHPLRAYRKREGMSLEALAEKVEVSGATISRIERWKQTPSLSLIAKLKAKTGLPADEFLRGRQ